MSTSDTTRPQGPSLVVPMILSCSISIILIACLLRVLQIAKRRMEQALFEEQQLMDIATLVGPEDGGDESGGTTFPTRNGINKKVPRTISWSQFLGQTSLSTKLKMVALLTATGVFVLFGVTLLLLGADFDASLAVGQNTSSNPISWYPSSFVATLPQMNTTHTAVPPPPQPCEENSPIVAVDTANGATHCNVVGALPLPPPTLSSMNSTWVIYRRLGAFHDPPALGAVLFNRTEVRPSLGRHLTLGGSKDGVLVWGLEATDVPVWYLYSNSDNVTNTTTTATNATTTHMGCALYLRVGPPQSTSYPTTLTVTYSILYVESSGNNVTVHHHQCLIDSLTAAMIQADGVATPPSTTSCTTTELDHLHQGMTPLSFAVLVMNSTIVSVRYGLIMLRHGRGVSLSFVQWPITPFLSYFSPVWSQVSIICAEESATTTTTSKRHLTCSMVVDGDISIDSRTSTRQLDIHIFPEDYLRNTSNISTPSYIVGRLAKHSGVSMYGLDVLRGRFDTPQQALLTLLATSGINLTSYIDNGGVYPNPFPNVKGLSPDELHSTGHSLRVLGGFMMAFGGLFACISAGLRLWAAVDSFRANAATSTSIISPHQPRSATVRAGHVGPQAVASGSTVTQGASGGSASVSSGAAASAQGGVTIKEILSPVIRVLQSLVLILGVSDSPLSPLGMLSNLPIVQWLTVPLGVIFQLEFIGSLMWIITFYPILLVSNAAGALSVELGGIDRVPPIFPTLVLWAMLVGFGASLVILLMQDRRELREVCTPEDVLHTLNTHQYDPLGPAHMHNNVDSRTPPVPLLQVPSPPPTGLRGLLALPRSTFASTLSNPSQVVHSPSSLLQPQRSQLSPQSLIGLASQFQRLGAAGRTVAALLYTEAALPDLPETFNWLRQSRGAGGISSNHLPSVRRGDGSVSRNFGALASLALSMGSPALRHAALNAAARSHQTGRRSQWSVPSAPLLPLQIHLGRLEVAPPTTNAPRESTSHLPSMGPMDASNVEAQVAAELEWRLQVLGVSTANSHQLLPTALSSSDTGGGSSAARLSLSMRSSILRSSLQDAEDISVFRVVLSTPLSPPRLRQSTVTFADTLAPKRPVVGPGRYGDMSDSDEDAVEQAAAALVRLDDSQSSPAESDAALRRVVALEPLRSSCEPTLRPRTAHPDERITSEPQDGLSLREDPRHGNIVVVSGGTSVTVPHQATTSTNAKEGSIRSTKVSKAKYLKLQLERRVVFQIPDDTVLWKGPRRGSLLRDASIIPRSPIPSSTPPATTLSPQNSVLRTTPGIVILDQVALSDILLVSVRTRKAGLGHTITHHRDELDSRQLALFGLVDMELPPAERTQVAMDRNGWVLRSLSWQLHVGSDIDGLVISNGSSVAVLEDDTTVMPSALTAELVVDGSRVNELLQLSGSRPVPPNDPLLPPTPSATATLTAKNPVLDVLQANRCPAHGCRLVLATRSHVVAQDIHREVKAATSTDGGCNDVASGLLFKCAYHGPRGFTYSRFRAGDRRKKAIQRANGMLSRLVSRGKGSDVAMGDEIHENVCPGGDNMRKRFYVCPFLTSRNSQFKASTNMKEAVVNGELSDPFCCRYAVCEDCYQGSTLYATVVSYIHFVLHYVGYRYFFGFILLAIIQVLLLPALRDAWKVLLCPTTNTMFLESSRVVGSTTHLSHFIQQASFCLGDPSSLSISEATSLSPVASSNNNNNSPIVKDFWSYTSRSASQSFMNVNGSLAPEMEVGPVAIEMGPATYGLMMVCAALIVTLLGGGLCVFIIVNLFRRKLLFRRHAAAISLIHSDGNNVLAAHVETDLLDAQYPHSDRSIADGIWVVWRRLRRLMPKCVLSIVRALNIKRMTILDPPHGTSDDEAEPYEYEGPPRPLSNLRGVSACCGRGWRWVRGGCVLLIHWVCAPLPCDRWNATLHRLDFSLTKSMYEHVTFRHMVVLQAVTYILTKWVVAVVLGATSHDLVVASAFSDMVGNDLPTFHKLLTQASMVPTGYSYTMDGLAVLASRPIADSTAPISPIPYLLRTSFATQYNLLEREAASSLQLLLGTALLEMAMSLYVLCGHIYGNQWVSLVVRLSSAHQILQLGFTAAVAAAVYDERGRNIQDALASKVLQLQAAWSAQIDLLSSVTSSSSDSGGGTTYFTLHTHNITTHEASISALGSPPPSLVDEVGSAWKKASAIVFIVYLCGVGVALLFALILPAVRAIRSEREWRREQREAAVEKGLELLHL